MEKSRIARSVKGLLVAAAAAGVCYWLWTSAKEWAQEAQNEPNSNFGTGFIEGLLAQLVGVASMPWALWAGMRLLRERGNHLLVLGGGLVWPFIGGHIIENAYVGRVETFLYGASFVLLGGLLSLAEVPRNRDLDT